MDKEYLIKKWLADELSAEERAAFLALDDAEEMMRIVDNAKAFGADSFSKPLGFEELVARKNKAVKQSSSYPKWWMGAAAAVLIGVVGYLMFFNNSMTTINTELAERQLVTLPDQSEVTLNAESQLAFQSKNWDSNREVNLTGEAFFKVAKGKVFDVVTPTGVVTVVGTQFNVYQRDSILVVKCFEGKVTVSHNDQVHALTAGLSYQSTEGAVTNFQMQNDLPSWLRNLSRFKGIPFSQVVDELERQYDLTVTYDEALGNRLFTGAFVHDSLEQALESLTAPIDHQFIIESENQVRLISREDN